MDYANTVMVACNDRLLPALSRGCSSVYACKRSCWENYVTESPSLSKNGNGCRGHSCGNDEFAEERKLLLKLIQEGMKDKNGSAVLNTLIESFILPLLRELLNSSTLSTRCKNKRECDIRCLGCSRQHNCCKQHYSNNRSRYNIHHPPNCNFGRVSNCEMQHNCGGDLLCDDRENVLGNIRKLKKRCEGIYNMPPNELKMVSEFVTKYPYFCS